VPAGGAKCVGITTDKHYSPTLTDAAMDRMGFTRLLARRATRASALALDVTWTGKKKLTPNGSANGKAARGASGSVARKYKP
jgi:hypothetical protein